MLFMAFTPQCPPFPPARARAPGAPCHAVRVFAQGVAQRTAAHLAVCSAGALCGGPQGTCSRTIMIGMAWPRSLARLGSLGSRCKALEVTHRERRGCCLVHGAPARGNCTLGPSAQFGPRVWPRAWVHRPSPKRRPGAPARHQCMPRQRYACAQLESNASACGAGVAGQLI